MITVLEHDLFFLGLADLQTVIHVHSYGAFLKGEGEDAFLKGEICDI